MGLSTGLHAHVKGMESIQIGYRLGVGGRLVASEHRPCSSIEAVLQTGMTVVTCVKQMSVVGFSE